MLALHFNTINRLANIYTAYYCKQVSVPVINEWDLGIGYTPLPVHELAPALQKNEPVFRLFYHACNNYPFIHDGSKSPYESREVKEAFSALPKEIFSQDLLLTLNVLFDHEAYDNARELFEKYESNHRDVLENSGFNAGEDGYFDIIEDLVNENIVSEVNEFVDNNIAIAA